MDAPVEPPIGVDRVDGSAEAGVGEAVGLAEEGAAAVGFPGAAAVLEAAARVEVGRWRTVDGGWWIMGMDG